MKRISIFFLIGIYAFTGKIIYSQILKEPLNIKVKDSQFDSSNKKSGESVLTEYEVNGKSLRLVEIYFDNIKDLNSSMNKRMKNLESCIDETPLFYRSKQVGRSFQCSKESKKVLIYNFGEKIYEISSESEKTIYYFTEHVLPLACHLRGSDACISMYY